MFVAWRFLANNMWFAVPLKTVLLHIPLQLLPEPNASGLFTFADAERVRSILMEAGWNDIGMDRHDVPMRLAAAGDLDAATEFVTRVGTLSRLLAEVHPASRVVLGREVAEVLICAECPFENV